MSENKLTVYRPGHPVHHPRSELLRSGAPIEYLVEVEYIALLEVAKVVPEHKLLIQLLWQTGLRVSEALALVRSDIYPDGINVLHGKGDKQRFVPCQQLLLGDLVRHTIEGAVFKKITTEPGVRLMLRRYAKAAGITKRIYPHLFRHSFAINFLRQTKDPFALQKIGGWSDMETVKIYMRLALESPREAVDRMKFPEVE